MRGRRRRRARSTWFPNLGITIASEGGTSAFYSFNRSSLQPNTDSSVAPWVGGSGIWQPFDCFALIPDQTAQISAHDADFTLRDYVEGQDWLLDSIVGSIHVGINATNTNLDPGQEPNEQWATIAVTVGIFVADAIEENQIHPDIASNREIDPTNVDNIRQPWVWRRTWLLSNPGTIFAGQQTAGGWPSTNTFVTGNLGPGIRTKTKRRIRRNQRIWLIAACTGFDFNNISVGGDPETQPVVNIMADLRICGKMRRSHNQSAF